MGTMTCKGHHDTDDIRAELARICDQFKEELLATVVPLCTSQQAPVDEEAEETRRTIEKIKAKEFISVEEAALLFGCNEQHLRNQVQKGNRWRVGSSDPVCRSRGSGALSAG
jgi:hypothetical protein